MKNNATSKSRNAEAAAQKVIAGTPYELFVFASRDSEIGRPYYHFKIVRKNEKGRYFATSQPSHVKLMVKALQVVAQGFSQIPEGLEPGLAVELAQLAVGLEETLSSLNKRDAAPAPNGNGLASAF